MKETLVPILTENGSFSNLRESGCLYVDKTGYLAKLIAVPGRMYVLSRPRRFGKTLTLSTLEAIFQGRRELFKGLAIDRTGYDWKEYPVIHIDFGRCPFGTPSDLDDWLCDVVLKIGMVNGITVGGRRNSAVLFGNLIEALAEQKGKVVVLVDEYDKVLSDNIFSADVEELRNVLRVFFQILKSEGDFLRFVFLTGVTKYAKVGVFSGLNNLNDLSLDPAYATMLGYTQEELETYFASYIEEGMKATGMGRKEYLARTKDMYDGYRFAPDAETVYNPVSVGLFFTKGQGRHFNDYWIDTGNMKLVMDMARSVDLDVTKDLKSGMDREFLSSFDVAELRKAEGNPNVVQSFLLQTGYLTIESGTSTVLYLRFPNEEVKNAYSKRLLRR